ncbi:hypothetical protein [Hymenobacter terricola]|uniref:hypothetical protein n=1 Tax=Hymenobacter terricola TaxID=2819236 RepID=UPI001B30F33D|nr:hypothetical protein [Hymenobacter terricola]
MLWIDETDEILLPKQYHETHNLAVLMYDHLVEILDESNPAYELTLKTSMTFKETHKRIEDMQNEKLHVLDWLVENDMKAELTETLTKHLVRSLTGDIMHFLHDSLNAAKKGKLSVAYALLRKPFTDELLILEQLLADNNEFIDRFYLQGDPKLYDPAPRVKLRDNLTIIKDAVSKLTSNYNIDAQDMHDIRYDKACHTGINAITNKALHIITTDPNYKTQEQNLNFIFAQYDDLLSMWEHYYYVVPYLLKYTADVIDEILFRYLPDEILVKCGKLVLREGMYLIWAKNSGVIEQQELDCVITAISNNASHNCSQCNAAIDFVYADLRLFVNQQIVLCTNCFANQIEDLDYYKKFMLSWLKHIKAGK